MPLSASARLLEGGKSRKICLKPRYRLSNISQEDDLSLNVGFPRSVNLIETLDERYPQVEAFERALYEARKIIGPE